MLFFSTIPRNNLYKVQKYKYKEQEIEEVYFNLSHDYYV